MKSQRRLGWVCGLAWGGALTAALCIGGFLPVSAGTQAAEEFRNRREALRERMEPGSALVIRGRTGGSDITGLSFRQDSNFFYLTGIEGPADGVIVRQNGEDTLFVARGEVNNARSLSGIGDVRPGNAFAEEFEGLLKSGISALYMDVRQGGRGQPPTPDQHLIEQARAGGAEFEVEGANRTINPLRRVKSPEEIERLRIATEISAAAHREAMRAARPGMVEYQLQAIIEYIFALNGAERTGFSTIVGSGPNSNILHWNRNTRTTEPGDVVVVDIGAEYGMYTADVTRTIPISGRFSERQRQIYEIVLKANKECIAMVRPGANWNAISARANEILTDGLLEAGLIQDRSRESLRRYYRHSLGHSVGLAVHDVGGLGQLEPGMVLTIEPGLYIREENIGFRIECMILVTEDGHVELCTSAPKEVEALESMMAEPGIDFSRYLVHQRRR